MRVAQSNRLQAAGPFLLGVGMAIAALALVLLVLELSSQPRGAGPPAAVLEPVFSDAGSTVAFWEKRVAGDPHDFVAHNKLAQAYLRRARETGNVEDYARAEAAVEASLAASRGDNYTATALLASIQTVQHEFAEAADTARQAIAIDPREPYARAALGDAQLGMGDYAAARDTYEQVVAMAPGLTSFSRLAHVLEILGDVEGADLAWQNALNADGGRLPENTAWAHTEYGHMQFRLGRVEEAERSYTVALEALPGYVHALAGLAGVDAVRGEYDDAIALYRDVLSRQPLPEYAAALGDLHAVSGDPVAAQEQYDLVLAIIDLYRAGGINTDLQTAVFLADHNIDLPDALRQAQAIYDRHPDSVYAADALAWALHKNGRSTEAVPYVRQAVRFGTPDPALHFHAGMIYLATDDRDAARTHLERANSLNPQFSVLHAGALKSALESLGRDQ